MSKFLDKTGLAALWTKITDTFAKKSDLDDYVDLTSNQEIGGDKTFTGNVVYKGWASFDKDISLGGLCVGDGDEVAFYPADKQYSIHGDMGTITFDPNGIGSDNGGVSECGIQIKMDDECYARLEPASLDIRYYGQNFYLSGEEGMLQITSWLDDDSYNQITFAGGCGYLNGTYGNIEMSADNNDEGNTYIKISSKDDPDNTYSYICTNWMGIYVSGYTFEVSPEDGYLILGKSYNQTILNNGSVSLYSQTKQITFDATGLICPSDIQKIANGVQYDYTLPSKSGTFALTNDFKTINGQSIIGSGDITISGGGAVDFYENGYLKAYGIKNPDDETYAFGFNDEAEPCILNSSGRKIAIATDSLDGNYMYYAFPEYGGTVALTSDIESAKTYQHDIYIMPGNSNTGGVYIYLTLNIRQSAKIGSVADLCSVLYNRGNNVQQQAVSATGKAGSSSTSFSGFIVGVWASSTSTLNVVYVTTTGTLTTTSYSASMFTSMRDTVN